VNGAGLLSEWSAIMAICKACLTSAAAVLGFGLLIGQASAMPANRLSVAPSQGTKDFQSISWVCDAYRYWYAPRYYAPNYYYGPGPYGYVTSGVYW
jgi:hypothetical protein